MVVGHGIFFDDNAVNFLYVLKQAVATYGIPQKLYLDNGAPYANQQLELVCAQAGIQLSHAPVRDGAAKGKIERLNRTLKQGWLSQVIWTNFICLTDVEDSFNNYLYPKYINKPHSSLPQIGEKNMTPRERFMKDAEFIRFMPKEELDKAFLLRYERKVRTDSTVQLNRMKYEVPADYMREKVLICLDPSDPEKAWVEDPWTKEYTAIKKLHKVENAKVPRKQHIQFPGGE